MKKDLLILLAVLIPIVIAILFVETNFSSRKITNPFASPTPFPTISTIPTENDNPTTISPASSRNIEALSPRTGDLISNGVVVKGNARVFENVVSIRLSDSEENVLIQTTAIANAPDTGQFGPFEKEIKFTTNATEGILEIYQVSAKDGSEIDKVIIPVLFKK